MAKRSERRARTRSIKKAAKAAGMDRPGTSSNYAVKHGQQANGNYRATSPFYLTPLRKAEALRCLDAKLPLPGYARAV